MEGTRLLHVIIIGPPCAQQRHRWARGRIYDPSDGDKKVFLQKLRAACPRLKPEMHGRIAVFIEVWTKSWKADADNFGKFYMDALSPKKMSGIKDHRRQIDYSQAFAAWGNDNQIDDVRVHCNRGAVEEKVEIKAWVIKDAAPKQELVEEKTPG